MGRVKVIRQRLNTAKPWLLILVVSIIWGGNVARLIHITKVSAGFWGITDDEIAVVTINKDAKRSTETIIITDPNKSFWDGLQLLGVPLVLVVLGAWFQKSQQKQAEQFSQEQREQAEQASQAQREQAERFEQAQREQDADEAREEVLQLYFDRVSALLIDENLMAIASEGEDATHKRKKLLEASLDIIRARTLSILRRFKKDSNRKSSVIQFLTEAEIISKLKLNLQGACLDRIHLIEANLKYANLARADLGSAYLKKANLTEANLFNANLEGADFSNASLKKVNLSGQATLRNATLINAILPEANLEGANLIKTQLSNANLQKTKLKIANLRKADLRKGNLSEANLFGAVLVDANLAWANLEAANICGANLTGTNLEAANFSNIKYDNNTIWPVDKKDVAKARNIPDELKRKLGLLPSSSQEPISAHQSSPPSQEPHQVHTTVVSEADNLPL